MYWQFITGDDLDTTVGQKDERNTNMYTNLRPKAGSRKPLDSARQNIQDMADLGDYWGVFGSGVKDGIAIQDPSLFARQSE